MLAGGRRPNNIQPGAAARLLIDEVLYLIHSSPASAAVIAELGVQRGS
jgi:hypothetical protein